MRKALVLIATAALLLGGAAFMVSSASGTNTGDTLRLRAVDVAEQFVDVGQEGFSQGDHVVFTSDLYAGTRKVGYDGGTCTVVRLVAEGSILHCVGTNSLPGGQVTVQGFVPTSSTGAIQPFQLAITGGTRKYRRAHGQVEGRAISDTELDLTLRIER
jgi:hypothetical protein